MSLALARTLRQAAFKMSCLRLVTGATNPFLTVSATSVFYMGTHFFFFDFILFNSKNVRSLRLSSRRIVSVYKLSSLKILQAAIRSPFDNKIEQIQHYAKLLTLVNALTMILCLLVASKLNSILHAAQAVHPLKKGQQGNILHICRLSLT